MSDSLTGRLEIKPRRLQYALKQLPVCLLMIVLSAFLIYSRDLGAILIGMIIGVSFLYMGVTPFIKALQKEEHITLTKSGIEIYKNFGKILIRWKNIDDIGICFGGTRTVGINLRNYDEYIAYIPLEKKDEVLGERRIPMTFGYFLYELFMPKHIGTEERNKLSSYRKIKDLKELLGWSRDNYGYDIAFANMDLDRSPDRFLELLEKYQKKFGYIKPQEDDEL